MMSRVLSLRVAGPLVVVAAFALGGASAGLWILSSAAWTRHLDQAHQTGQLLYDAQVHGAPLPEPLMRSVLPPAAQSLANSGKFEQIAGLPKPALVTYLSLSTGPSREFTGPRLQVALVSPTLRYPLADLAAPGANAAQETVGGLVRLLATYCSDAVILAQQDARPWVRLDGPGLWSCAARPPDYRLLALLLGALSLGILASLVLSTSAQFTQFAGQLAARQQLSGPDAFRPSGPEELRRIIGAFNRFREVERQHLAERALVLSGVTHDLGTPAQRLKLRASLIEEADLRQTLIRDIDQMTGIIESVLTYTRTELSTEAPRQFSLTALVEAAVEDFQDIGQPAVLDPAEAIVVEGGGSIFMSQKGRSVRREQGVVIVTGRPVSLRRALSNLIDNALKYGRRASVRIETDAKYLHILVEDAAGPEGIARLEGMTAPFKRGGNAQTSQGFGMGLTIVSAIAQEHGGALSFEPGQLGTIARLTIAR